MPEPALCQKDCGVLAVGRCSTCGEAFCATHQARVSTGLNKGNWFVDYCTSCQARTAEAERASAAAFREADERRHAEDVRQKAARPVLTIELLHDYFRGQLEPGEIPAFRSPDVVSALMRAGVPSRTYSIALAPRGLRRKSRPASEVRLEGWLGMTGRYRGPEGRMGTRPEYCSGVLLVEDGSGVAFTDVHARLPAEGRLAPTSTSPLVAPFFALEEITVTEGQLVALRAIRAQ